MGNRGGPRPNSGRPKGKPNKDRREIIEKAKKAGIMPLDYMLEVMRDKKAPQARRDAMAQSAAPYLHPKLATIQHTGDRENPVNFNVYNKPPKPKDED